MDLKDVINSREHQFTRLQGTSAWVDDIMRYHVDIPSTVARIRKFWPQKINQPVALAMVVSRFAPLEAAQLMDEWVKTGEDHINGVQDIHYKEV